MTQSEFYLPKRFKTMMWVISDASRRVGNLLDGSGITHTNVLTRLCRSDKVDPPGGSSNDKSDSVISFNSCIARFDCLRFVSAAEHHTSEQYSKNGQDKKQETTRQNRDASQSHLSIKCHTQNIKVNRLL